MKSTQFLTAAVVALGLVSQGLAQNNGGGNNQNNNNNNNANANANGGGGNNANANNGGNAAAAGNGNANAGGDNPLLLLADNVQDASNSVGQPDAAAGQSDSDTDPANFINFCTGKTLTNGKQVTQGSCNGIVMGEIPSNNNMVSAVVLNPANNDDLEPDTQFNVQVQITNLVAGSFTDPINTYYAAPQQLQGGNIVGHCHVTIQDLNNDPNPQQPPDPKNFAFFKGINDDGNGAGLLQAVVTDGLPAGTYRVCTMNSASNHQPVLMPVAQRGAQDDCVRFTVGAGNGGNAGNGNNAGAGNAGGNGGNGNNAGAGNGAGAGGGAAASSTAADGAAATDAAGNGAGAGNGGGNNTGNGGNGNNAGAGNGAGAGAGAGGAAASTTAAAAATTTAATGAGATAGAGTGGATGGQGGNGRGGRGRGRFGRGRKFAARDFIA